MRRVLRQYLQRESERATFQFSDQQMNVFGHDSVAGDIEPILLAHAFEGLFEYVVGMNFEALAGRDGDSCQL